MWRMIELFATPFWNRLMTTLLVMAGTIPVVASWLLLYFRW